MVGQDSMAYEDAGGSTAAFEGTTVFRIAYDGGGFSGFAEQRQEGVRTVGGEVRSALETFLRRPVDLVCAGRTDAGVHAIGQYVSFPATSDELEIGRGRWLAAMRALFPEDVSLLEIYHAVPGFSARFDARSRTYTYRIVDGDVRPLLTRDVVWWHRGSLDDGAMEEAAQALVGEHDFKSFCKVESALGRSTCRRVSEVSFERRTELGEDLLAFTITGNAFLHTMVRTIMGSLVEVGAHRREPAWLGEAMEACDRSAAGPTAPAKGLCFVDVSYDEGVLAVCP